MRDGKRHSILYSATMRKSFVNNFLNNTDWAHAGQSPLAGDASFRQYIRLTQNNGERAMLMDAPPPQEDVRPFIQIAELLLELGLSAPHIIARDAKAGFLLLEDFGDDTYSRLLEDGADELELYQLATDTLIKLHRCYTPRKTAYHPMTTNASWMKPPY